jgi:small subunit ribosomal protein S17
MAEPTKQKTPAKAAATPPTAVSATDDPRKSRPSGRSTPSGVPQRLEAAPAGDHEHKTHSFRRRLLGKVVSDKMDKTVVVEVVRRARHPVYKKYVRNRDRYKAHDEKNEFKVGDRVEIMEHRPISKDKRWRVIRLVARAVEE